MNPARNTFPIAFLFGLCLMLSLTGCGGSGAPGGGGVTPPAGNTQVVLLLTSTANDQLVEFNTNLSSIVLTSSTGSAVTIYTNPQTTQVPSVEWMHLNGASEPFLTANVPDGTYTSAQVTIANCAFTNVTNASGLTTADYDEAECVEGTGLATVNFPAPIAISGTAMALSLNLQVDSSWTLQVAQPLSSYTIDPTFTLTPVAISSAPTTETNGKILGLNVSVTSIDSGASSFAGQTGDGATFTAKVDSTTAFQGIAAFSNLVAMQTANLDLVIQPDGSFHAARVEVDNPGTQLVNTGFAITTNPDVNVVVAIGNDPDGCTYQLLYNCEGQFQFYGNTVYGVSGQLTNLASLPFAASFGPASAPDGQYYSAAVALGGGSQNLPAAQTITLEPQTFNGTVNSVSNQNGFAVYSVSLAPYNLIAVTQGYDWNHVPITDPTTLVVYVGSTAQFVHTSPVEVGDTLRFRGVVLDDNGALRMDCSEVLDGVPQ